MEILLIWLLFGVVTAVVASNKGRNGLGWFFLGMLLGPFGFILSLVVSKNEHAAEKEVLASGTMKKCPFCAELVKAEAKICKHCGKYFPSDIPTDDLSPRNTPIAQPNWDKGFSIFMIAARSLGKMAAKILRSNKT